MRRCFMAAALSLGLALAGCGGGDTTGTGGAGGSPSTGGSTGGGGTAGSGAGGSGGSTADCTPVALGELLLTDGEAGGSSLAFALTGLDPAVEHAIYLEFYDVAGPQIAGSFDLSQPPDDNYATCARCLLAFEDVNGAAPTAYFQTSGALDVTAPDAAFTGKSAGTFDGVRLGQVTLEGTSTVPVAGGKCLLLTGAWDTTQP